MADPAKFELLGVRINTASFRSVLDRVLRAPVTGERLSVHFATVHSLVEAHDSAHLRAAFAAGIVEPDGMPLVWLGRRRGFAIERVCGPDFLPAVVSAGIAEGRSHFFVGGGPGVPEALARNLSERYPGLQVAGILSPPFRTLTPAEDDELVDAINASGPDYVWVGLGAPKQDMWLAEHRGKLNAAVILAVGAAFDFHAGVRRRAPTWMQRSGTEWLFRLATEPRRLAARYTRVNARFARLLLAERARRRNGR